jgi:hypothetical protein
MAHSPAAAYDEGAASGLNASVVAVKDHGVTRQSHWETAHVRQE